MRITQNSIIMGLKVGPPKIKSTAAEVSPSAVVSLVMMFWPSSPMPEPSPVMEAVKLAWRDMDRAYSRTGTVENRLTAIKPLKQLMAVWRMFPLPDEYSMPNSKQDTTRLTANSAQPSWEKNCTVACTQSRSNSSTPMLPMRAKNAPKKPTAWLYAQSSSSSITVDATKSQIKIETPFFL